MASPEVLSAGAFLDGFKTETRSKAKHILYEDFPSRIEALGELVAQLKTNKEVVLEDVSGVVHIMSNQWSCVNHLSTCGTRGIT